MERDILAHVSPCKMLGSFCTASAALLNLSKVVSTVLPSGPVISIFVSAKLSSGLCLLASTRLKAVLSLPICTAFRPSLVYSLMVLRQLPRTVHFFASSSWLHSFPVDRKSVV